MNPELWRSNPLLALASLLPLPLGAAWMAVARGLPGLRSRPALAGALTWALTRVAFAALVWGALGHAGIDQLAFFMPQARAAIAGGLPYRDFASAYAPLFAPLLALATLALGPSGPFTLFLAADFVAWRAIAAAEGESSEAAWAYAALPFVWYFTVRYGQDEALAAMMLALAWWAWRRERPAVAGLLLGLGFVVTKPLFALPALAFALAARSGRTFSRLVGAALLPVAAVYGAFIALGAPVLQPLELEGATFGVGPTLWRVPVALMRIDPGPLGWLPCLALIGWGVARLWGARAPAHAAWQFGAFAALAPKFMPMYAVMWAPLLCVWAGRDPDRRGWLLVYGALLPFAWPLDSGPLQGMFGVSWHLVAALGLIGLAALALWPVWSMARGERAASDA